MSRSEALRRRGVTSTGAVALAVLTVGVLAGCGSSDVAGPALPTVASAAPVPSASRPEATAADTQSWGGPTWADEFDGTAPAPIWGLYDSAGNGGNGLRRPSQVSVADGVLTQTGTADATSAGMLAQDHDARFGRWEVRARADQDGSAAGRPYHLVVALIPASAPYESGARDLDFAEADVGAGSVHLFVHYPPSKQDYADVPLDLAQWHTYGVEVTPDHVTWFVDGVARVTDRNPRAVPSGPMALNAQLDANEPDGMTPGRLQLDWARYYALPPGAPPAAPDAPSPETGNYGA